MRLVCALAVAVVGLAGSVQAAPILDQFTTPDSDFTGLALEFDQAISQSFTVGIGGILSSVDVRLRKNDSAGSENVVLQILTSQTNPASAIFTGNIPIGSITSAFNYVSVDVSSAA